jgi:Zn-dependent M28 family amino/carboxypeptidase
MAESAPSKIKVTKTPSPNSELFTQQDVLETIVNLINETRFKWFDSILSNNIGPRPYYSTSNLQAAEFIAEELNATKSISATYQWFTYAGKKIANVIGTLPSANPKNQSKIVVGAHFDTVSNSPGADDDGSGIALLLEVAKVLSQFKFNCSIEFVAFNAEEVGKGGSSYYVQQASQAGEDILLMFNIDMCLWSNPNAPPHEKLWIVYQGTVPYENCESFADITLNIGYTYTTAPIQKISSTNNTYFPVYNWYRSDHANFWTAGIPALWIFEFNGFQNPYIHTPADSMNAKSYNFTLGTQAAQVVAATTAKLAQTRILLGTGWGWMRVEPTKHVWRSAELYKIGETRIELVIITHGGEDHSRTWDIIKYWNITRNHRYWQTRMQIYLCYSEEWGHAIVRISDWRWRRSWSCLGRGVWAFGFT